MSELKLNWELFSMALRKRVFHESMLCLILSHSTMYLDGFLTRTPRIHTAAETLRRVRGGRKKISRTKISEMTIFSGKNVHFHAQNFL